MKLSQPKSAREINTYRVLNAIRENAGLSRAEIARSLSLNKVSTGEIVDDLIAKGLVKETGRKDNPNGRPSVALALDTQSRILLAVDIGPKTTMVGLFDLSLANLRFERIPTICDAEIEDFCVNMLKSSMRTLRLADENKVLGVCITISGSVDGENRVIKNCSFLPWKDIPIAEVFEKNLGLETCVFNRTEAMVKAERPDSTEAPALYIDWSETIDAVLVRKGEIVSGLSSFGHIKVSNVGLCECGRIGCLSTVASMNVLSGPSGPWSDDGTQNAIYAMAGAICTAAAVTGCTTVVLGGAGASIPDVLLPILEDEVAASLPAYSNPVKISASSLGDKASLVAGASAGLDFFFFRDSVLQGMSGLL